MVRFFCFFPLTSSFHLRQIPNSSYGVVYLAIDRQTGEEVAVKAMSKRRPKSTRERTLKKLVREAALQARVQHCSGVVEIAGAFEVSILSRCFLSPPLFQCDSQGNVSARAPSGKRALSRRRESAVFVVFSDRRLDKNSSHGGIHIAKASSSAESAYFFYSPLLLAVGFLSLSFRSRLRGGEKWGGAARCFFCKARVELAACRALILLTCSPFSPRPFTHPRRASLKKPKQKKLEKQDAECAYLVMERLRGGDLDQALSSGGPLSERAAAAVAHECLKVVATCHAAGVMHGDVKPANFMLREAFTSSSPSSSADGETPTIVPASTAAIEALVAGGSRPPARWLAAVDFGCAQPLGRASLNRRTGTPVYMAPEVFQRDYGREADLWSAGVMLYQLLSGRFPFWRSLDDCRARSVDEVMRSVLGDPVPLSGGAWETKSPACVDLLAGLLDRDPGSRLTAADALEHPWFREQLGGSLTSTTTTTESSNIVPMAGSHLLDGHSRPAAAAASAAAPPSPPSPSTMRPHVFSSSTMAPACAWYAPGPSGMAVA